jgi:methyl-accepting chemotaxis protein
MSATTRSIAANAAAQSGSAERMAAAVTELAASIHQVTGNVRQAQAGMDRALEAAGAGQRAEAATTEAMAAIRAATARIVATVRVIDEIARRTNLLSLNAAIEAAKAGAQGRGFAVVPDEVRKLAERSAQAAHEVRELAGACEDSIQQGGATVDEVTRTAHDLAAVAERLSAVAAGFRL